VRRAANVALCVRAGERSFEGEIFVDKDSYILFRRMRVSSEMKRSEIVVKEARKRFVPSHNRSTLFVQSVIGYCPSNCHSTVNMD
jgi:hypothetical protein